MYQGTLQPRLENHWGIKTIKWRKYWRDLWFQQLPESILVKSIIKGKCPHGIQLEGQQMRKRHSSGEGGCRAGIGGEVLCSVSSPGPGWAGCGAVGREQCVDGKNTEWTLVNPWFFTSASLLQVRLTFLKALRVLPLHAEEENKAGKQQNTDKDYLEVSPNFW